MPNPELPHTSGCVACGRDNPQSLGLSLHVNFESGDISAEFVTQPQHIGFEGIIHGGVLATVLDEAMVWAATWSARRFCVCGELNVRYRSSAAVGRTLKVAARIASVRSRLIEVEGTLSDDFGLVIATATGKYVPVSAERNREVIGTLVPEAGVENTLSVLRDAASE